MTDSGADRLRNRSIRDPMHIVMDRGNTSLAQQQTYHRYMGSTRGRGELRDRIGSRPIRDTWELVLEEEDFVTTQEQTHQRYMASTREGGGLHGRLGNTSIRDEEHFVTDSGTDSSEIHGA